MSTDTLTNDIIPTRKYFRCTYSEECKSSISMELPIGTDLRTIKIICPLCIDFRLTAIEETLKRILGSASLPDEEEQLDDTVIHLDTTTVETPAKSLEVSTKQSAKEVPNTKSLRNKTSQNVPPSNSDAPSSDSNIAPRQTCVKHFTELCDVKNCPDYHPKTCPDWLASKHGCKLHKVRRCNLMHPDICETSWHRLECFDSTCKKRHLAKTTRNPNLHRHNSQQPQGQLRAPRNVGPQQGYAQRPGYANYRNSYVPSQDQINPASNNVRYNSSPLNQPMGPTTNMQGPPAMYNKPPPPPTNPAQTQSNENHFLWEAAKSLQSTQLQMNALLAQLLTGKANPASQYPQANLLNLAGLVKS